MVATQIAEKYVDLSHGRTRYFEAGTGHPTILLHGVGYTAGGDSFAMSLAPLASKLRVIAPDALGWGTGDRVDIDYSFELLVDWVRELQDALGLKSSHIVGHSMGGWLASLFAYESPERVDKLVLVASGGTATRTLASMTQFSPPPAERIRADFEARMNAPGMDMKKIVDERVEVAAKPENVAAYQRIMNNMNNPATRLHYNTLRRLPMIKAPTLVLWGSNDQTNALELGQKTAELVPNSKLVVLDGIGHMVPNEAPDQFTRALLDFLD